MQVSWPLTRAQYSFSLHFLWHCLQLGYLPPNLQIQCSWPVLTSTKQSANSPQSLWQCLQSGWGDRLAQMHLPFLHTWLSRQLHGEGGKQYGGFERGSRHKHSALLFIILHVPKHRIWSQGETRGLHLGGMPLFWHRHS